MKVGDSRFGKWVMEMPERMSFNPVPSAEKYLGVHPCEGVSW